MFIEVYFTFSEFVFCIWSLFYFVKTALHYACEYGNPDIIEVLCKCKNIDCNKKDNNSMAPLHYAAKGGNVVSVKLLLNIPKIQINIKNNVFLKC